MCIGRPLFAGSNELDQIVKIFKMLGTPSRQEWPGIDNFHLKFQQAPPKYPGRKLSSLSGLQHLPPLGLDLMEKMLQPNPAHRISAEQAMKHAFFHDLKGAAEALKQRQIAAQFYAQQQHNPQTIRGAAE